MDNKSYFAQLLELHEEVNRINNDTLTFLYNDSIKRVLDFRDGYYDEEVEWKNSNYVLRNLRFITECMTSIK